MNRKKEKYYYWAFLFPSMLAIFMVIFLPLIYGIYTSFTNSDGYNMTWIGLQNYKRLLNDSQFISSMWFTLRFALATVIGVNVIGLGLALLVTQKFGKVSVLFRTVYFMPNLIGGVILGFIWQFIF